MPLVYHNLLALVVLRLVNFKACGGKLIFGPKKDEVTGEWIKLHNEELHDLYSSPTIVQAIKSRRMRSVGQVARMGEGRGVYRVLVGNLRERDQWGDLGVMGR
jgi:hypothetical protein